MSRQLRDCDVLVVGGGPAGMAAAYSAAQDGRRVTIVDDNAHLGGQIWRGDQQKRTATKSSAWFAKTQRDKIQFISGATVFLNDAGSLLAETPGEICELRYARLVLATGARERFLPFPGWTLPNVMGAGGLQALVKSGLPIRGKKVVVAGSGPLLLAVAAYLRACGADVRVIAEQAPSSRVLRFALGLSKHPTKAIDAVKLRARLAVVPYLTGCWPVTAEGDDKLSSVTLRQASRQWQVSCDYLACGFGLVPNLELAQMLECEVEGDRVRVDDFQETSQPGVYCAGESTGVGGVELSLVEGRIAGHAAAGNREEARGFFASREKHRSFAELLNRTFELRKELKTLSAEKTFVCRCEDVSFEQLREFDSWRAAKLHTRCGMGPCQGRVCGAAVEFLFNWKPESVRPPIFPVRVSSLAHTEDGSGVTAST